MSYYLNALTRNFANFNGRARRREYWMFVLCNVIAVIILSIISAITRLSILPSIYSLIILLPSLAISVRRLHDIGKSGMWIFIGLIPIVGAIWLLILTLKEGMRSDNEYGADPK